MVSRLNLMEHIKEYDKVYLVQSDLLDQTGIAVHGFSTRIGGVSNGVYESLNVGYNRGDKDEAVLENLRRVSACFGISPDKMLRPLQTHTDQIRKVTLEDAGTGATREVKYKDVDGVITNESGILLFTLHADCAPIFLLDPEKKAIGMIHSGWKGTCARIGEKAVRRMNEEFHSRPEDILAWIGPCICKNCYEVGTDVATKAIRVFVSHQDKDASCDKIKVSEMLNENEILEGSDPILRPTGDGKFLFDIKEANLRILLEAGLKGQNISVSALCTYEREDLFFSHRRMGANRGTMGAFIALK